MYKVYGGNAPPWKRGYRCGRGWSGNNRAYQGRQDGEWQDGGAQGRGVEKLNPKNRFGDYLRCHGCGSFRHMIGDCQDVKPGSRDTSSDFRNKVALYMGNIKCYTSEVVR